MTIISNYPSPDHLHIISRPANDNIKIEIFPGIPNLFFSTPDSPTSIRDFLKEISSSELLVNKLTDFNLRFISTGLSKQNMHVFWIGDNVFLKLSWDNNKSAWKQEMISNLNIILFSNYVFYFTKKQK